MYHYFYYICAILHDFIITNPFEIIFNNTLHEKINLANIKILGSNKLKANKKGDEGKN